MTVNNISNTHELYELMQDTKPLILFFSGLSWCRPCISFHPHFEGVAGRLSDQANFAMVDIDKADPALLESYQVASVPTVIALNVEDAPVALRERVGPKFLLEVSSLI